MDDIFDENPEVRFVGGTGLKKATEKNQDKADFLVKLPVLEDDDEEEILYLGKKRKKGFLKGYLKVNDTEYIEYRTWGLLFIILLGLLGAALIISIVMNQCGFFCGKRPVYDKPIIGQGDNWNGEIDQAGDKVQFDDERIEIPGYHELYVTASEPIIGLGNPEVNTVYFKYEIKEGDRVVYETDYIEPGKQVRWNAYETLSAGDHNLSFVVSTVDVEAYYPCNGATLTVLLHVN